MVHRSILDSMINITKSLIKSIRYIVNAIVHRFVFCNCNVFAIIVVLHQRYLFVPLKDAFLFRTVSANGSHFAWLSFSLLDYWTADAIARGTRHR